MFMNDRIAKMLIPLGNKIRDNQEQRFGAGVSKYISGAKLRTLLTHEKWPWQMVKATLQVSGRHFVLLSKYQGIWLLI